MDRLSCGMEVGGVAERRMFSKSVVNSARFLRMPQTSRLLYYDLGMAADDDGVVEAFTVIRTTGAAEDDLRVLASRGFVTVLNEDLVSHITDWSQNNYIQKDRYHPSIYSSLLVKIEGTNELYPSCIQDGYMMDTQARQGKASPGEERQGKGGMPAPFSPPSLDEVDRFVRDEGLKVNSHKFFRYYADRGWRTGEIVMNDWHAVARSWSEKEKGNDGSGINRENHQRDLPKIPNALEGCFD